MSKRLKRQRAKVVGRSPAWLKTVQIAKRGKGSRIPGTFGAASPVKIIKPGEDKS